MGANVIAEDAGVPVEFLVELYQIPGNRVALKYLTAEMQAKPITIFAGNDVAVPAGYPRWDDFIPQLAERFAVSATGGVTQIADATVAAVGRTLFYDSLEEAYGFLHSDPGTWRGAIRVLPYLTAVVMTINLDDAIEEMYAHVGMPFSEKCPWDRAPRRIRPAIWKLHGTFEERETVLSTSEDFEKLQALAGSIDAGMQKLVEGNVVVTIGLWSHERWLRVLSRPESPCFVIFNESVAESDARTYSKLGVRLIRCPNFGGDGEELLLRYLVSQVPDANKPHPARPLAPYEGKQRNDPVRRESSVAPAPPEAIEVREISVPHDLIVDISQDLVQACTAGECVLFAGAGLSARSGVRTWNDSLTELISEAKLANLIEESYAHSLQAAIQEGDRDSAADGLVQAFEGRRDVLYDSVRPREPVSLSPAHEWLRQIPFAAVVTTNYDMLLENAFPEYAESGHYTPHDAEPLLDALAQKRKFLLKLYGLVDRPETLIFAPIEYRELLSSNIPFSKFMEGMFFSRSFFFVGLSLEGIQDFLSGFVFRGTSPRKHFALVAVSGSAWRAKAELLLRRFNIQVIAYSASPSFAEFDTFLEKLSLATRPVATPQGVAPEKPAIQLPGVRRVLLEDIGPFERLELDFPKGTNWKILLGDNGVGKSTILKAIAVAIMGSDARSFAARLVRSGKTRGRITLITENNPSGYVTDILTKDMLSEAEVVSLPARPMEAEGWLALGFSPLRIVTWTSATGPQPVVQKGRPTSDDLVPLVSGEADPRMDRLKQWIVNLDAADRSGKSIPLLGHTDRVGSLGFAAYGKRLISGSIDKTVRIWDPTNGRQLMRIDAHTAGANAIATAQDVRVVASGSYDRTLQLWSLESGRNLKTFKGSETQILTAALSNDGQRLISGSEGGSVRIWNVETGNEIRRIKIQKGAVWSVCLSPDDRAVAAASDDGIIRIFDVESGRELRRITTSGGAVWSIAWSTGKPILVSGSEDGSVVTWDAESGELLRVLRSPARGVLSVAISQDGRLAAAGDDTGGVHVWDIESGRETMSVQAHSDAVWSVAFAPNGQTLATGSSDGSIRLWELQQRTSSGNHQDTIRKFFRVFGVLTDRKDVDFLEVTPNFRVMVKVSEAATTGVPLEVLSQGMTSLLGWVGVLCQRLKETLQGSADDPLPTQSYALVLIDELDAHMHPRWQQVLVDRLKEIFPNVQFIASTHSPLVVGGLSKEEVDRFTIRKGHIAKVDFEPDMTLGRTDQILTGELFGLPTTLDATTQKMMEEYEVLLGKSRRTEKEDERFQELGRVIEERIPPAPEQPVERRARELLEALQSLGEGGNVDSRVQDSMAKLAKVLRGEE